MYVNDSKLKQWSLKPCEKHTNHFWFSDHTRQNNSSLKMPFLVPRPVNMLCYMAKEK